MKKILIALLVLFLVYASTGWFLAPLLVDKALRQYASDRYGLELTFDKLTLYPFSFSTRLDNLVILDSGKKPLFTAAQVEAKTGFLGFWTQSGVFSSLVFFQPRISLPRVESERREALELAVALAQLFQQTEQPIQIAILQLLDAEFVSAEGSGVTAGEVGIPSFDFESTGFGESGSGEFQLTLKPSGQSETRLGGELGWDRQGAHGTLRWVQAASESLSAEPVKPLESRWRNLSLEVPFEVRTGPDFLTAFVTNARLGADSFQLEMQRVAEVEAAKLTAEFNATFSLTPGGLLMRDVTAASGPLDVSGLPSLAPGWIRIPVSRAELKLPEYVVGSGRSIPFHLAIQTEPAGEISLAGQYDVVSGSDVTMIDLKAVPLSSILDSASGMLPSALWRERVSGKGRLELSLPATAPGGEGSAAIVLSGEFESGGAINLEGMTDLSPSMKHLHRDGRLEWDVAGVDASVLSSWAERFAGREVMSGTFGSRLDLSVVDGKLTGHYGISLDNAILQALEPPGDGILADPDFTVALLQDAEQQIRISLPLDEHRRGNEMKLSSWLQAELEAFLSERAERPMDTLAWAVGMRSGRLDSIVFEPGQAGLSREATARLGWLTTALQWRPGLALRVSGAYDPIADRDALAGQQIRLHVNLATAVNATERERSAPIDFADAKARSVLDEFAGSRLGKNRVAVIALSFRMDESVVGPEEAEAEKSGFYRALFDALVENEQISERALLSLARFRARTIIDQLARGGVERSRLQSGEPYVAGSTGSHGVPADLDVLLLTPEPEKTDVTVTLPLVSEPKFAHIDPVIFTRRIK